MKIEYMTLGPFATNTYIVYDEKTLHGVVIDPSFSPDKYISELNDKKIILESILLTHAHVDHLAGLNQSSGKLFLMPSFTWIKETRSFSVIRI